MFGRVHKWQWEPIINGSFKFELMYGMQHKEWDPGSNYGDTVIIRVVQQQHGGTSIEFSWNLEFQCLSSSTTNIKLLEDNKYWERMTTISPKLLIIIL